VVLVFADERRQIQTSPLSFLRDCRLGIDAMYWLKRLVQSSVKDATGVAMGGVLNGLRAAIEKDLAAFKHVIFGHHDMHI
jgi:hypothetical protein